MNGQIPRLRILVVDDDPDIRTIVAKTLERDFEVMTVGSGVEVLERLDIIEPDFLIIDVMMPVLSGVDTSRAIRKDARFSQLPIVFLTARTDNEAIREAMRAGADFYLQKPFDPQELLRTVQMLVRTRRVEPRPKRFGVQELVQPSAFGGERASSPAQAQRSEPFAELPDEEVAIPGVRAGNTPTRRVRIMIVDDDRDVVNYVKSILREDYEVIGLCQSEQAPEKIVAYQPDILLLDIVMPTLNGFHLSHLIRIDRRLRGSKIIFVSSRSDHEAVQKAFALGASEYVEKPFTPEQLRRKLLSVTRQPDFVCRRKRLTYAEILRREGEL